MSDIDNAPVAVSLEESVKLLARTVSDLQAQIETLKLETDTDFLNSDMRRIKIVLDKYFHHVR